MDNIHTGYGCMPCEPGTPKEFQVKSLLETAKLNNIEITEELYLSIVKIVYGNTEGIVNNVTDTISNIALKYLSKVKEETTETEDNE